MMTLLTYPIYSFVQAEIDRQGVDCEESRHAEERLMLADAKQWVNARQCGDAPHAKTGATALHVAAAKGYVKVMRYGNLFQRWKSSPQINGIKKILKCSSIRFSLAIQSGAAVNSQDLDGWTPLHAAAHWAQREACEILVDNYANFEVIIGYVPTGQE